MLLEKKTSLYPPSGAAVLVLTMVSRLGLLLEKAGRSPARSGAAQGCARLPAHPLPAGSAMAFPLFLAVLASLGGERLSEEPSTTLVLSRGKRFYCMRRRREGRVGLYPKYVNTDYSVARDR